MADPGTRFLGRGKPGQREQPAHESLSSRATLAEVPLTGLSFGGCFRLLGEIFAGQRPLRVFRQMKMYNDPTMNPYLYKTKAGSATA